MAANYWNALAALMAFALPLLLALATSARTLYGQAAAAAGVPIVVLTGYLTFSRGGAVAAAIALIAFLALAPERFPKLATVLVSVAGSAALIAGASTRSALERGLADGVARHQGATLVLPILLVCAGVALAQVGIGLAARHGTLPRRLAVTPRRARLLLGGTVVALIVAALLAGAPAKLSHAWRDFKTPTAATLASASLNRFGSVSSNGRYELWKGAIDATRGHVLTGSGPGTFQLLWLPRAPRNIGYVRNAHSLYLETLAELGVVGLVLLVGFLVLVLGAAVVLVSRSRYEKRTRAAGAAAALTAFVVSAAFDWIWQVPVLPVAFMLLGSAVLAPSPRGAPAQLRRARRARCPGRRDCGCARVPDRDRRAAGDRHRGPSQPNRRVEGRARPRGARCPTGRQNRAGRRVAPGSASPRRGARGERTGCARGCPTCGQKRAGQLEPAG